VVHANSSPDEIVTDLCIIGAGPAGITIARELSGSGIQVCLLDSGGRDIIRRTQRQNRGESTGHPLHTLRQARIRAFGGTLRHPRLVEGGWAARPLDPIDFEHRADVPESGWPFGHEHLRPFYARAERACALPRHHVTDTWVAADDSALEPTAFQFSYITFADTFDDLTASPNVRLMPRCRVAEISADAQRRRVERIVAVRDDRSRVVVRPRFVVLAAGGIENARLLLAADGGRGIGNDHDMVGRYFADRLALPVGYVVPPDAASASGATYFARHGNVSGAVRMTDDVQRGRGLLNSLFYLVPRPLAVTTPAVRSLSILRKAATRRPLALGLRDHLSNIVTGPGDIARFVLGSVTSDSRALVLRAQSEQTPNRDSRVTLGSRRDDLGMPQARVTWRFSATDHESIRAATGIVAAELRSRGFGALQRISDSDPAALVEGTNHHHMGATRMHADPRDGVVDADQRVHSMANLYIAGCSVFPTYGASNPTLTIVALSLRLADHLRDVLRQRDDAGAGQGRDSRKHA